MLVFSKSEDGAAVPLDGEDLGFEAAAVADGTRDKDVGEELHFDAFVAEPWQWSQRPSPLLKENSTRLKPAACAAGVGHTVPDEFPRLGVERGFGARRARKWRLVDEHDLGEARSLSIFSMAAGSSVSCWRWVRRPW